jgi:iron(III) transport system permease protein
MAVIALPGRRTINAPLVLIGLAVAVAAAMALAPLYLVVRVAGDRAEAWDLATSASTLRAVWRTSLLAAAVTASAVAIAVPAAWLTVRTDLPLRRLWGVLLALPLAFPSYVGAFAFVAALGPRGMLQDLLQPLGVDSLPEIYGFAGAWLALTLFTFPYVLLPVRAALRGIDGSLEEASRGLGKGRLTTLLRVTVPQLRPAIAAGGLLVALYTLSDFGAVSILRFDSLTRVIYLQYTASFDRSAAAALALILVALALVVVSLEGATRGRAQYHVAHGRGAAAPVRLGAWRWPALAACGLVVGLSLVLPTSVIVYWLARGLAEGQSLGFVREAAFNSVYASALAAGVAVAAAIPVSILTARHPGPLSGLLEKATYAGFALPGIVIALALVFFAANYAVVLYQTLALLVFAYVVRFLPQAVGACRAALLQINPATEEAARGLGRGPARVFARITLPQMLPGMSAGAALVFLTAIKELPATLLLSPIGFETLATQIWSATREALFAQAALPALILVALSAAAMALMLPRERKTE